MTNTELLATFKNQGLFDQYAATRDAYIRERLILDHQNLALFLARKYLNKGEDIEDLFQVATIGLMNAIDRFNPNRGLKFSTFATPTILGEIRHHFRDRGWLWKVPRRIQELYLKIVRTKEKLQAELCREPDLREISERVGATEEEIAEALAVAHPVSLDAVLVDLGATDPDFERVDDHAEIEAAVSCLNPRLASIIRLKFFEGLPQIKVARRLKISQMHVSRLQYQAMGKLRMIINSYNSCCIQELNATFLNLIYSPSKTSEGV